MFPVLLTFKILILCFPHDTAWFVSEGLKLKLDYLMSKTKDATKTAESLDVSGNLQTTIKSLLPADNKPTILLSHENYT